jgi:hypothetical protein
MELDFLGIFSKNTGMSNILKIRPLRAEFSTWMDGWMDRQKITTKTMVGFHNFGNALNYK